MRSIVAAVFLISMASASAALAEVPAPRMTSATEMAQLETPLPTPYD